MAFEKETRHIPGTIGPAVAVSYYSYTSRGRKDLWDTSHFLFPHHFPFTEIHFSLSLFPASFSPSSQPTFICLPLQLSSLPSLWQPLPVKTKAQPGHPAWSSCIIWNPQGLVGVPYFPLYHLLYTFISSFLPPGNPHIITLPCFLLSSQATNQLPFHLPPIFRNIIYLPHLHLTFLHNGDSKQLRMND